MTERASLPQGQLPLPQTSTTPDSENTRNISLSHHATDVTRIAEAEKPDPDAASDKATAAFIRRTLCSHNVLLGSGEKSGSMTKPIEEVLPPLTSSNAVDLQLYAIISVIIKEFVQTWYSKITPDQVFVNEVVQIIAHCTRALEQRLRNIDLEALLLDEIPELLENHLTAFRLARTHAVSHNSLVSNPRLVYHTLHPHPALSPVPSESVPSSVVEQRENESAWRQLLVQGVLAVLLPTEDLQNGCLRSLVAEIFAEMILGNGISGKACEGWLLWEGITRIAEVLQHNLKEEDSQLQNMAQEQPLNDLERYGLLSTPGEGQSGSTKPLPARESRHGASSSTISGLFWVVLQYAFLLCTAMRALFIGIAKSPSLPLRSVAGASGQSPVDASRPWTLPQTEQPAERRPLEMKRPIVSMKLWSCASQLVELDLRMPWLSGLVSMLHWVVLAGPGRVGDTDGVLDRFLSYTVQKRVLNPATLPSLLRTVRATLFPNNALGPARQPPSAEEANGIKRRCAASLLALLPAKIATTFFATNRKAVQLEQIEDLLDCLDDPYLNKHLIFQIVELIILRLVPELGEGGVKELLEERLG